MLQEPRIHIKRQIIYKGTSKNCFKGCSLVGTIYMIKPLSLMLILKMKAVFRGAHNKIQNHPVQPEFTFFLTNFNRKSNCIIVNTNIQISIQPVVISVVKSISKIVQ